MAVVVIALGVRLVEHAHAGLDELTGLGLEVQWRKFFYRPADGAIGPGDDGVTQICVVQHVRRGSLEPGP